MVGRDPSNCQVVLADDEISRLHAWIGSGNKGEVVVEDRHSANGTFVNQVRVQEKVLKPGDEISVGSGRRHLFRIEEVGGRGITPRCGGDAGCPATKREAVAGGTSVISPADIVAAQEQEKVSGGTVAIKLTDLLARPHLELIVDRYAVKSLDIPDAGLQIGRDSSRCQLVLDHPSVSSVHSEFLSKRGRCC